jgi:hypothetical protein
MDRVSVIGLRAQELAWVRLLVDLLRHPDPVVGEVTREALGYLEGVAARADESRAAG